MKAKTSIEQRIRDLERENRLLKKWKRQLFLMLRYSRRMSATIPVDELLELIAQETREIMNADRCSVLLVDKMRNELWGRVAHGMDTEQLRFPVDRGLAGFTARTGEVVNVKDAYKDLRFNPEIDRKTGYRTRSVLCYAMKNHLGEVIGVFQVLNKRRGYFTHEDEELLRILSSQAAVGVENAQLYDDLKRSFESFINTLVVAIDARDPMTAGHSHRVTEYVLLIAEQIGISREELQLLRYAAILHDLGKIGVREAVLTKPNKLTEEEYNHIRSHAVFTHRILSEAYFQEPLESIPVVASSHHERIDGSGYPNHLKGEAIPKLSRIIAVADVFDAITHKRHYRDSMPIQKAFSTIRGGGGTQFDSEAVRGFMSIPLDKLIRVLGSGVVDEFKAPDLQLLSSYTPAQLLEVMEKEKSKLTSDEKRVVDTFNRYYEV
ncbi:MAG TPA: GAF domain-containing protein [Candidatus Omnitrophica bacterium]|nr:GAF domain-containing protein [Candidatus Omnitrophota bacterium]